MSFLCALPLVASLLSNCAAPGPIATGYVEGEFTFVAPVAMAQIDQLHVHRGDRVDAGVPLVQMATRDAEIALAQAEAGLAQARNHLADLMEARRPEEIRVIEANLASARAQATEAERTRDRVARLAERGSATDTQRDDAVTRADVALAKVAQVEAELAVARLPARPQAIAQAEASVTGALAARDQAAWHLEQRQLSLPQPITVFDVIRNEGEIAGPSAPVLSVLADGAVKLRLYVPEASFSEISIGARINVSCDSCPPDLSATIVYISDEPEFTPPVIYSLENRQKLVYLVEALPDDMTTLKPGQIVDVVLQESGQ